MTETPHSPLQGAWVQSLVGVLDSTCHKQRSKSQLRPTVDKHIHTYIHIFKKKQEAPCEVLPSPGLWASPVRMDWSTLSVVDLMSMRRRSAGTLSPTVEGERLG